MEFEKKNVGRKIIPSDYHEITGLYFVSRFQSFSLEPEPTSSVNSVESLYLDGNDSVTISPCVTYSPHNFGLPNPNRRRKNLLNMNLE